MDVVDEEEYRGRSASYMNGSSIKNHISSFLVYTSLEGKFESNNIKSYYCNCEEWKSQHSCSSAYQRYLVHSRQRNDSIYDWFYSFMGIFRNQ